MTLRAALILIALGACKNDKPAPAAGSAAPPPPPVVVDASKPVAPPVPTAPAPPPSTFDQSIRSDGVGPIKSDTDPATIVPLFPGLDSNVAYVEAEDHASATTSFSTHGVHVLDVVVDKMRDEKHVFRVDIFGGMLATHDGIRVGSTVAEFLAKDDSIACQRRTYTDNPEGFDHALYCETAKLPNLTFYLDDKALPGSDGKVIIAKLAQMKFTRIIWLNPSVK
jgi:hypothetical protein